MTSKLPEIKIVQAHDIQPNDSAYLLAVVHHSPAKSIDESEIESVIRQYQEMNWEISEREDSLHLLDDGFTVLKFRGKRAS